MAPGWSLIPLVILATAVTVIASQAVITGAFSIAQQAMSLGLFPRMSITHTSETEQGQIYVPQINWMVLIGVIILVLVFKSSSNLASAYGIAVNTSMIVDSILALIFFWKARNAAALDRHPPARADLCDRSDVPRRQRPEACQWRLHAGAARRHHHHADGDLDARPPGAGDKAQEGIGRTRAAARKPRAPPAHARRRCRRLPADRPALCAERADAQSQAQSRAA